VQCSRDSDGEGAQRGPAIKQSLFLTNQLNKQAKSTCRPTCKLTAYALNSFTAVFADVEVPNVRDLVDNQRLP